MVNEGSFQDSLEGKAAVVTGASSGIGAAVATALARRGVRVTLVARRRQRLTALAGALDGETQVCAADFSEESQVADAMDSASRHWGGGLDILVNAAGIARVSPLRDGNPADWRALWEINVLGLAMASREALKHFPEPEGGHIVNLGSMSGHRVPGRGGFYAATKFAVRAITEGLRQELRHAGSRTRVSSISPGFVDTPMLDEYFSSAGTSVKDAVPYPMLQPEDIAETVVEILRKPKEVEVTDVLVRPRQQVT